MEEGRKKVFVKNIFLQPKICLRVFFRKIFLLLNIPKLFSLSIFFVFFFYQPNIFCYDLLHLPHFNQIFDSCYSYFISYQTNVKPDVIFHWKMLCYPRIHLEIKTSEIKLVKMLSKHQLHPRFRSNKIKTDTEKTKYDAIK